jgi:hypothetical protein
MSQVLILLKAPLRFVGLLLLAAGLISCASDAPSVAHVHVGHVISGHKDTPTQEGFFVLAEKKANDALVIVDKMDLENDGQAFLLGNIETIDQILNKDGDYTIARALQESSNHLVFAADSPDSSASLKLGAKKFTISLQGVLSRIDLVNLYVKDAQSASDVEELRQYAEGIRQLVRENVNGVDADGNGTIGNSGEEAGLIQLREVLDEILAAESPTYRTVDRWYLFNLIRLPNGDWIFNRGKSGKGAGY